MYINDSTCVRVKRLAGSEEVDINVGLSVEDEKKKQVRRKTIKNEK